MTSVSFMVPGRPKGKGRPRFVGAGRPPITPKATVAAEREIATEYRIAARATPLMTGTVTLTIEAVFRVPKSWPKYMRAGAEEGRLEYTGKPDRDNLAKLIMDALNGVAWVDDAQVNRGPIVRRYGYPERVEVTVEETKADGRLKSPAERRREAKVASGAPLRPKRKKRAKGDPTACEDLAIGKRLK